MREAGQGAGGERVIALTLTPEQLIEVTTAMAVARDHYEREAERAIVFANGGT